VLAFDSFVIWAGFHGFTRVPRPETGREETRQFHQSERSLDPGTGNESLDNTRPGRLVDVGRLTGAVRALAGNGRRTYGRIEDLCVL